MIHTCIVKNSFLSNLDVSTLWFRSMLNVSRDSSIFFPFVSENFFNGKLSSLRTRLVFMMHAGPCMQRHYPPSVLDPVWTNHADSVPTNYLDFHLESGHTLGLLVIQ